MIIITLGYQLHFGRNDRLHLYSDVVLSERVDKDARTFGSMVTVSSAFHPFQFVGTILGGIWADQSWGRFWGWDPKENGAFDRHLECHNPSLPLGDS